MRIIFEQGNYRIVEYHDTDYSMEDLKGDTFDPLVNSNIAPEKLREDEREFEQLVAGEGVYGYELERWNPQAGKGWEHVDSCWGFVGQYRETNEDFKHYIVEEMKSTIKRNEENV